MGSSLDGLNNLLTTQRQQLISMGVQEKVFKSTEEYGRIAHLVTTYFSLHARS